MSYVDLTNFKKLGVVYKTFGDSLIITDSILHLGELILL